MAHESGMGVALMASPLGDLSLSILNGCLTAIDILATYESTRSSFAPSPSGGGLGRGNDQGRGVFYYSGWLASSHDRSDGPGPVSGKTGLPAQRELAAYFEDGAHAFQIPLRLEGTDFQQRVWRALREIPPGQVATYGELARRLGTSARAVGNACRRNPCPIVVPCHRVVAAQGLGGYDGQTQGPLLERKRWLLRHEGAIGD